MRHKINDPFNIKAVMLDIPEPSMLYLKCTLAQARLSLCRTLYVPKYREITCADPGPDPHSEKSQKYRVFWQYRSGSPEKSQLLSQHSMLGIHRHASETPLMAFRWRADDGPLKVGHGSSLPPSTLKTNVVKVGSPLTNLSGSAHELCPSTV